MSLVLGLIESAADEFGAHADELTDERGVFSLPLTLADGRTLNYRLEITTTNHGASVREVTPVHLPAFCPQRHINSDGTFCLYWSENGGFHVTSAEDATKWWGTLLQYLRLQARAERRRRWPNNDEWAHGEAARHQQKAIAAAARLGPSFSGALRNSEITVQKQPKRRTSPGPTVQVLVRDKHVYSVWLNSGKVVNRKQRCFCGSAGLKRPARLRGCQDHADAAAELALELTRWEKAEELFWKPFENTSCCGTCDNCPLQAKINREEL